MPLSRCAAAVWRPSNGSMLLARVFFLLQVAYCPRGASCGGGDGVAPLTPPGASSNRSAAAAALTARCTRSTRAIATRAPSVATATSALANNAAAAAAAPLLS